MSKVGIVTPKFNSTSTSNVLEKAEKRVTTAAKKIVSEANERFSEKPLDLNYDEIYESKILAGRNPYTGKVHYISADFLDRYI